MGILTTILDRVTERRAHPSGLDAWPDSGFGTIATNTGVAVNEDIALTYSAVWACVRVLSETAASLPLIVHRRLPGGGKARFDDHQLSRLLHGKPNPDMTQFTWKQIMTAHAVLWGNSFNEIEFLNNGDIGALWPLLPDRTRVERKNKVLRYITQSDGKEAVLPASKVLHVPGMSFDGITGYSVIRLFRESVGLGLAAEEFGARFYGSGATPKGVLEFDGQFENADAKANFRKQ